jgi:hypothetical protein
MELALLLIKSEYTRFCSSWAIVRVPFHCYNSKSESIHMCFSLPRMTFRQRLEVEMLLDRTQDAVFVHHTSFRTILRTMCTPEN